MRNYANLAVPIVLAAGVNASAGTLTVGSTVGFPDAPFLLGIERGTANEEVVLCTNKTSTTFTVTRGYDGTTGKSHAMGSLVEHTVAAIDYREAGIVRITTAQRDALTGEDVWEGRTIYNTDLKRHQTYIDSAWEMLGAATGTIDMFAGSTAPSGTLLCSGQAVSRSTYANLFSVIGTTYGSGNGSTTFNVPDLRQRFPLGVAASGTGNSLGATGGQIDHTHTGPLHTHSNPATDSAGSHHHSQGNTGSAGAHVHTVGNTSSAGAHTHRLVYQSVGVTSTIHGSAPPGISGSTSSHRHADGWPDRPDTNERGSHTHTVPNTQSAGSHTHSIPDNLAGAHTHTQGPTGASGDGLTGSANPPFIALNFVIHL